MKNLILHKYFHILQIRYTRLIMYIERKNLEAFDASFPLDASALSFSLESGSLMDTLTCNTKKIIRKYEPAVFLFNNVYDNLLNFIV